MSFLPSKILPSGERPSDQKQSNTSLPSPPPPPSHVSPPSMICVTGVMFREGKLSIERPRYPSNGLFLKYRVFRPRQILMNPPALVVLHGGPGVPSNYLMGLVNVITDRAVVLFDQLGCGGSSRCSDEDVYSIEYFVEDLRKMLEDELKLKSYFLFGHSFGGILGFEYLKSSTSRCDACRAIILSSVPTSTKLAQEASIKLLQFLRQDQEVEDVQQEFSWRHECRIQPMPLSLVDAYAQASSVWRGVQAIPDYEATGNSKHRLRVPCLVLRGQHDFITQECVEGWKGLFKGSQTTVLSGCSHHGLLESERLYGDVIAAFLSDHDP